MAENVSQWQCFLPLPGCKLLYWLAWGEADCQFTDKGPGIPTVLPGSSITWRPKAFAVYVAYVIEFTRLEGL
jgi:hypothetical protein